MAEPDRSSVQYQENLPLRDLSTLQIGGPCRYFTTIHHLDAWVAVFHWGKRRSLPRLVIGEGSNILFHDAGFRGLVVRNELKGIHRQGTLVEVAGGENLGEFIRFLNRCGLAGMERMYGIPGTVAGAVVGNAGAYGQEISDHLTEVDVWTGATLRILKAGALEFAYRDSIFKRNPDWFIVRCRFEFHRSHSDLQAISEAILARRTEKYPPRLRCPGSYFKNVLVEQLTPEQIRRIPTGFIQFGKIPAGRLLDAVGAKGACRGQACFASYHANLIINCGGATAHDVTTLAQEYSDRVRDQFSLQLEPEIRIIPY